MSPAKSGLAPALDAPRREVDSAAGRISYYADTQASGRPLLLLHSLNAAPSAFEVKPLFEAYRANRPVYALDLPGFGFSQRGPRDYSVALFTTAFREMLERMDGAPPDVVALSLTSELAARLAAEVPSCVATLCLISPTGFGLRAPPGGDAGERIRQFLSLPLVGSSLFRLITSRPSLRYFLSQSFHGQPRSEMIDYAYDSAHQPGARYPVFHFLSGALFARDAVETIYSKLETPTLILYDEDPHVSFEKVPAWQEARSHRRADRISPSRGLPHWEELDATCRALDDFWNEFASP